MQRIVDIPQEIYNAINADLFNREDSVDIIIKILYAIENSTPLPKGHGDLKDMDDIYEALEGWNDDTGWIVDAIDCQVPTIIEADKEESEE